jgi:hypothetical protein
MSENFSREDLEVVFVYKDFDFGGARIIGQEVVSEIFGNHNSDPFARVDRFINDNRKLDTFTDIPLKIYTDDYSTTNRGI